MGAEQSYFMVPVTSGLCIEPNRSNYNLVYTRVPDQSNQNQHWVLERQGNKVAFRNVAGKDYLYALGHTNSSQVRLQSSPHWWSLEPGRTAGSFWVKSEDVGGFLCNPYGAHTENNQQCMWSWKEPVYTQRLLFYLQDTRSLNGSPDLVLSSGPAAQESEQVQAKAKETEEKEAKVAAREKEIAEKQQKLEDIETKEKELGQRQKQLELREKEAAEKQKKADDLVRKQREFDIRQKEFEARQKAAAERQTRLEEREKKVAAKESASGKSPKSGKDAQTQVEQLQAQLAEANKALEDSREREESSAASAKELSDKDEELAEARRELSELKSKSREPPASSGAGNTSSSTGDELAQARRRVAELQAKLNDVEKNPSRVAGSDDRWRSSASMAAGARRTKPPGLRTDYDFEKDSRWKEGGSGRNQIPGLGEDFQNDPRWTSNAPGASRTKQSDPEGVRTQEPRPVKEGELRPIVMTRDFGYLPRLGESPFVANSA